MVISNNNICESIMTRKEKMHKKAKRIKKDKKFRSLPNKQR